MSSFLSSSALPADCRPESVDVTFKAHLSLLRRLTTDPFESHNRYMFIHKPLARANAVLAASMLTIPDGDSSSSSGSPMSAELRSAVMYVACNSFRSVYGMAYAGQMKSVYKSGAPPDGQLSSLVINGLGLSPEEDAALDFAQKLSSLPPAMMDASCHRLLSDAGPTPDSSQDSAHLLERQVTGVVAYAAFMCRAHGALDVELSYEAVKYAATNLSHGLQWNSAGRHFNFDTIEDITDEAGVTREGTGSHRGRPHARRLPNLISSSVTVPRLLTEANRAQDSWLRAAWIPKAGKLLEINDCIKSSFGFFPFYLSVSAVLGETQRRALLYGARELLFLEGEVSRRLKFIISYVTSLYLDNPLRPSSGAMERPNGEADSEVTFGASSRPLPRSTYTVDTPDIGIGFVQRRNLKRRGSLSTIVETSEDFGVDEFRGVGMGSGSKRGIALEGPSDVESSSMATFVNAGGIGFKESTVQENDATAAAKRRNSYNGVDIIKAHAAFLACRYGATAAELVAAADEKKVIEAMERYLSQADDDNDLVAFPVGFPLTKKDCAAVLLAHSLAKTPPDIPAERLQFMESAFGKPAHGPRARGGRSCHRATLEVLGASSMWGLLERYCVGAVTFDVDYSANLYFAGGPAEPTITEFVRGAVGREIGLILGRCTDGVGGSIAPWVLERANTYRASGGGSIPFKDRFMNRSRKRSVSFLSSTGERMSRIIGFGGHQKNKR
jgi:alkylhydroperoxidase family enzyme